MGERLGNWCASFRMRKAGIGGSRSSRRSDTETAQGKRKGDNDKMGTAGNIKDIIVIADS